MYIIDVNCELCENNGIHCHNCIHNYLDNEDYFKEMADEEKIEIEELKRQRFMESLQGERIEIMPSNDFKRAFKLALNFTSRETYYPNYWSVYCGEGYLMATDGFELARIKVCAPKSLVGKHILVCSETEIVTTNNPSPNFANGESERILNKAKKSNTIVKTLTKKQLNMFIVEHKDNGQDYLQLKAGPVVNEALFERAMAAIDEDEEFTMRYLPEKEYEPLLIEGKILEYLIMPVRRN